MYLIVKRFLDILLSLVTLLILSPLFIIVILILLVTGDHEVFYQQNRVGFKNQIFGIWKFATMVKDSHNLGTKDLTTRNDPRVTPVGRILRMTKLNELPQIWNIFIGDMTLVGPRPLMKSGFDRYPPQVQRKINDIKPGITGIGSILFRDEEGIITASGMDPHDCYEKIIQPQKGAAELWYQKHMSLVTDLKIIFLTAWAILVPNTNLHFQWFPDLKRTLEQSINKG